MMITTEMIKKLREQSGAGIMICKKTLVEAGGDMQKAVEILKEMEAVLAAKKAERATFEGLVSAYISEDKRTGAMVELACETDFVAANRAFVEFGKNLARQAATADPKDVEECLAEQYEADKDVSVREAITSLIARFGENIALNKIVRFSSQNGFVQSYVHNGGKIGVLVELKPGGAGKTEEAVAKEIAMQVAAANPLFLERADADNEVVEKELPAYRDQAQRDGKPAQIVDKIVLGKIAKFYRQNCLLEQPWIKDENQTVARFLKGSSEKLDAKIEIVKFVRFECGKD